MAVTNDTVAYSRTDIQSILPVVGWPTHSNIPLGAVAYGSVATSAVHVAGTIYLTSIVIRNQTLVTNINVLQGATATTDNLIGAIFADITGTLVVSSALAGVLQAGGASTFLALPLTTPTVLNAGRYWIGIQSNGTTGTTQRIAASTYVDVLAKTSTGVFATLPTQTLPTTFTAASAPVVYVN